MFFKRIIISSITLAALALVGCGGDSKNNQPTQGMDSRQSMRMRLVKNISALDRGFSNSLNSEYQVAADRHCFQLVEIQNARYLQVSINDQNRASQSPQTPSSAGPTQSQGECRNELQDQSRILAQFRLKQAGTGVWRLTTDFGHEVGSFIEDLTDNNHKDSMTELCTSDRFKRNCRLENDGRSLIRAVSPVNL